MKEKIFNLWLMSNKIYPKGTTFYNGVDHVIVVRQYKKTWLRQFIRWVSMGTIRTKINHVKVRILDTL